MPRGSRKHVLDWTGDPRFLLELLALVRPVGCCVTADSVFQPMGPGFPVEARLETFGPRAMPTSPAVWKELSSWWLAHGGNTPNWDIALSCSIEHKPGLILVEAKANYPELGELGKRLKDDASTESRENHDRICRAIDQARIALEPHAPGISISCDKHYQLSNRIAFAWWLASHGIPTVLLYLGFTGDADIANVGEPFPDDRSWQDGFRKHFEAVCPPAVLDRRLELASPMWILSRSRSVPAISSAQQ
jgi:hypothetical protein